MNNLQFILVLGLTLSKSTWQSTEPHFDIRSQKKILSSFVNQKDLSPDVKFLLLVLWTQVFQSCPSAQITTFTYSWAILWLSHMVQMCSWHCTHKVADRL